MNRVREAREAKRRRRARRYARNPWRQEYSITWVLTEPALPVPNPPFIVLPWESAHA